MTESTIITGQRFYIAEVTQATWWPNKEPPGEPKRIRACVRLVHWPDEGADPTKRFAIGVVYTELTREDYKSLVSKAHVPGRPDRPWLFTTAHQSDLATLMQGTWEDEHGEVQLAQFHIVGTIDVTEHHLTPELREELRVATTLALFQRAKNTAAIHTLIWKARDIATSMTFDRGWRDFIEALDVADRKIPSDPATFARTALGVEPSDWDYYDGNDYDRAVETERVVRGLIPTEEGQPVDYEHPADILRRLK